MGTAETLTDGDVQFMTAGTGVRHSEHNNGNSPLRFIQMWFFTRKQGLTPNYGSMRGNINQRQNKWHHIVTDVAFEENNVSSNKDNKFLLQGLAKVPIKIHQDVNIFVTELEKQKSLPLVIKPGRQV